MRKPFGSHLRVTIAVSALVLSTQLAFAQEDPTVVTAPIRILTKDSITIDQVGTFRINLARVVCEIRGKKTTCETLIGVGYADIARITMNGNVVERINVIELAQ